VEPRSPATEPPPQRPSSEGERKQVTVLACELNVEDTSGDAPDPERQLALAGRLSELARNQVERFGGVVHRFSDRGFLALFGAPVAHEDHARRAVLTARELAARVVEQAPAVSERHGVGWSARMGIDTGPVVVGGSGEVAVGEAIDHAEQLMRLAEPGTLLIGDPTRKLVEPWVSLEPRPTDAGQVPAWRVVGVSASPDDAAFREENLSPFVGRGRELAVLDELRAEADAGRGQVVGIAGEAGAGKSRLVYEFRKTLQAHRGSYLRGECLSYGTGVPYLPFVDMIRQASKVTPDDDDHQIATKLRASLERVGTDLGSLPYLLRLLGVREGTEPLDELEPQALQKQTFAAMRRMILDASRRSLVVVEIEDLHWIDETSEDFLASLVEAVAAARVLLLLTYRSGYQPPWLDRSYTTQIAARRLSPSDSQAVARAILERTGAAAELADEAIAEAIERAEGNPFFLEELARTLAERGSGEEVEIPNTVRGILTARIDRLPEVHKQLLQTASVLGRELPLELLQELWDRPESLAPILEELRHWEFLYRAPIEEKVIHGFRHTLTQEVAYQSLLTTRRRAFHARAAAALETLHAGRLEDVYDRLIYHYPRAGEPEKTVHYLALFAVRAARGNAHHEAARALRQALEHAGKLPEEVRDRRLVELLLQLAESLLPLASFPETLELFESHLDRLDHLDDPSLTAQYHFWLAHTHTYLGDQEKTRHHAERAIEAARECGDEITEGKAHYVLGRDEFWAGELEEGLEHSQRAVALLERHGEPWWQGQAYWVAGFHHFMLGQHEAAFQALERARDVGEALDDYRLDTSWSLGYMHAASGEPEKGIEECRRGLERVQDPLNTAVAMGFLGYAYLEQGEIQQAVDTLREAIDQLEGTGMQQILGWFLAFLGEAHARAGRLEEASEIASRGMEISRQARFQYGVDLAERTLEKLEQEQDAGP